MTFRFARPTTHDRLPTVESGMLLRHIKLSVVVPEATVNLVTNPSIEIDTTGYTAANSAIARVGTQARRGASSLQVTPTGGLSNAGVYYGVSLTAGTTYTFSADVKGQTGVTYRLTFNDNTGVKISKERFFVATGQWQRIAVSYAETSSASRRLYIVRSSPVTSASPFYVDGVQLEAKAYATTYCDGDQKNTVPQYPAAYQWQGAFQASQSLRRVEARHGGKVVSFEDIGFQVSGIVGFGMNTPQNVASPFGLSDGALFQRTLFNEKTITIAGAFHARSVTEMERMRSELYEYLSRDKSPYQQPIRLFIQLCNNRGDAITDPTEFYAVYAGGLEQTVANPYQENVSIKLQLYNPFLFDDFDTAYSMTGPSVISSVYLAKSDGPGHTTQLTQVSGGTLINAMVYNRFDGKLYVGGNFTSPGNFIFAIDLKDNTISTLGTGASGTVNTIVIDESGRVGIGGAFSLAGGVACNNLAYWNGSVWAAMGTGTNGEVKTIIKDTSGQFIVGGAFTTFNGTAAQNLGVMVAFGSGMLGYATGANSTVYALALDSTGTILYAGGDFTTYRNGLTNNRIVKTSYAPSTQNIGIPAANVMGGAGANSTVRRLTFDHVGILYIGGAFTSICGVTTSFLAAWNGTSMSAVNNGTIPLVSMVSPMTVDSANNVYIEGFLWNGTSFTYPPGPRDTPLYIDSYDTRYLVIGAGDNYGTVNTITYTGTAIAYPKFHIVNSLAFSANDLVIVNATTRKYFYLSSIGAHVGIWVDIFIDFDPDTFSIVTADGRALDGSVLPQSQAADMYLVPGQNEILVIWTNSSYNADTVTMTVKNAYQSISDVVR